MLEFLVAILGGLPHLEDLSRAGHPLDQDSAVALAWQQAGWADYSGVSRTLQALTMGEAEAISQVLDAISQRYIDSEIVEALREQGYLLYDGDLTGRPVADMSTSYPGAAYGYMDDEVRLGYQAAVIMLASPTYRRLWLSVKPHPGNTLSCTQVEAMVKAVEARTQIRPQRRSELLRQRLLLCSEQCRKAEQRLTQRQSQLAQAQAREQVRCQQLEAAQARLRQCVPEKQPSADGGRRQLACQTQVENKQRQYARQQALVLQAQQRVEQQGLLVAKQQALEQRLHLRLQHLQQENAHNPAAVRIIFRLDAGFATWENVTFLIEMGYEVYTKPDNNKVVMALRTRVDEKTTWTQVGANAEMVAWSALPLKGCPYPIAVALTRFYTGSTLRYSALLYFGPDPVTDHLPTWFTTYNGRQLIEAAIKEGKGTFQMHHLKVRSAPALWLQEQFAAFAANFVRWAARWLDTQCLQLPAGWADRLTDSVKLQVQVAAHAPAHIQWLVDGCLLRFTEESSYAGRSIVTGPSAFQLSLPLFKVSIFP